MSVRICRTEKFIPTVGQPVYQIQEELTVNGIKQLLPPRTPTSEELEGAEDDFAAAQQQTIATLTDEKTALETQVTTLTSERDAAIANVAALTDDNAALTEANATLTAQLAAANARIATLLEQVPFNPRVMEAKAFLKRLLPDEVYTLLRSEDEVSVTFGGMLDAYIANDWPVVLDSEQLQAAMAAFVEMGKLTQERASALTADCTRDEAYVADGE